MVMKDQLTIFYTDDDLDDLDFFREIVEVISKDYIVVTQRDATQLWHALSNPPPTPYVVFLDINMPGTTGLEILKKVRESGNHGKLPIVMFSTTKDRETIEKSLELGANFYVPKSGIFEQLKRSIEYTLQINWNSFIPTKDNFVYIH